MRYFIVLLAIALIVSPFTLAEAASPVTNLLAKIDSDGDIALTWTPNGEQECIVWYRVDNADWNKTVANNNGYGYFQDPVEDHTYYFYIYTYNGGASKTVSIYVPYKTSSYFNPIGTVTVIQRPLSIYVRRSPNDIDGNQFAVANPGERYLCTDYSGKWYKILYPTDEFGWVYGDYVSFNTYNDNDCFSFTIGYVNIRKNNVMTYRSNSSNSDERGTINAGNYDLVKKMNNGWYAIIVRGSGTEKSGLVYKVVYVKPSDVYKVSN